MSKRKRMSQLEKLATPVIERVKKEDEAADRRLHDRAAVHAVNFAAIVLFGDPKVEEPLAEAWLRCIQSDIWQDLLDRSALSSITPFKGLWAEYLAKYLYREWVPTLPGNNEKEKLDPIFLKAERWLIWFTFADWTANVLNFALPDLSKMKEFDRSFEVLRKWPCLPEDKFELRPRQNDFDDLDLSVMDMEFFRERVPVQDELTRLERKRFNAIREKLARSRWKSLVGSEGS